MTPARDCSDALADMADAMGKVSRFVSSMSYEQFAVDDKTVFAVVRALEIVGEAAKQIPTSVRQEHPHIPWREMAGMRDKLIHHYFGVVLATVWRTATEDVPELLPSIRQLMSDTGVGA